MPHPRAPHCSLLTAALALATADVANGLVQLLPAGEFAARDGRPGPGKKWTLSDKQGRALAERLNAVAAQTPIAIDYEHQTIMAATNGQPAPSAGYMLGFEWRDGAGLWARVQWTERALAFISAGEYRYISPVITYDAQGQITGLHNAALVSTPGLLGMDAVQARLAAAFDLTPTNTHPQESRMDLTTLVALLGLAASASAADVTAAIQALLNRPALPAALATQLGLQANADEAAALAALASKLATPDAATLQTMTALQAQVSQLQAAANERTVAELVDGAIAAHKLVPAQRDWAVGLGKANLAQLQAFVNTAVPMPGLAGQLNGRTDPGTAEGDTAEALAAKAVAYQAEQAALGRYVDTVRAMQHVAAAAAKA